MKRNSLWGFLLVIVFVISILIFCCFYLISEIGRLSNKINEMTTIVLAPTQEIEETPLIVENKNISSIYRTFDNSAKIELTAQKKYKIDKDKLPPLVYLGNFRITGYDICVECCGKTDGVTASMTKAIVGRTCAAPRNIPFGTVLYIEGVGERIVEDRGGAIRGNKIDVLCNNHKECYAITGNYQVWIVRNGEWG